MGKNLIQQARGRGGPRYRAPSFRYAGVAAHPAPQPEPMTGTIIAFIHSQGHSSPLVKVAYASGEEGLGIASEGLRVGDTVTVGSGATPNNGNTLPLTDIPESALIFNIESMPGDGGKFVRASGTFAKIVAKGQDMVNVLLPSKKVRAFLPACRATIGVVAGGGRVDKPLLKAGTAFHEMHKKNKLYPRVSGVAMNAVDHPFGGKKSSHKGRPTQSPRDAPPGRKVGMIAPRRTGRK
ncbi:MAG TPA: 50S ribosomal protein L2 [Candidatus Nanoarchaeia archaeon]|nr:50S ribosomal protein L2 [Candidatus Nanoarchaeia archaeon]